MDPRARVLTLVLFALLAPGPVRAQFEDLNRQQSPAPQASAGTAAEPSLSAARLELTLDGATHATANAGAGSDELKAVGTLSAKGLTRDGYVVEGPSAFDKSVQLSPPGLIRRFIQKIGVWFSFGLANSMADRLRLWGPPKHYKLERVTGAEMEALTRPGPNGEPASLQPGDLIVNGANGHAGHLSVYTGDDPKTGRPMIVHSMANTRGQQSYTMQARNVVRAAWQKVFGGSGKTGVIEEPMGDFFDRYRRDTVMVLRDSRMTPEMRARGVEKAKSLVGKKYDYSLSLQSDDAMYCSELGVRYLDAAYEGSGKESPWIGTTWISQGVGPAKIEQWVATPANFTVSPDLKLAWANGAGKLDYAHNHEAHVVGSARPK